MSFPFPRASPKLNGASFPISAPPSSPTSSSRFRSQDHLGSHRTSERNGDAQRKERSRGAREEGANQKEKDRREEVYRANATEGGRTEAPAPRNEGVEEERQEGRGGASAKLTAEKMQLLIRQVADFTDGMEVHVDAETGEGMEASEGEEEPPASTRPSPVPSPLSSTALVLRQRQQGGSSASSSGESRRPPLGVFDPPPLSSPLFSDFLHNSAAIDPLRPTYPNVHLPTTPPTPHVNEGLALDLLWRTCGYEHLRDLNPGNLEWNDRGGVEGVTEEEMAGIQRIEEAKRRVGEGKEGTKTRQERQDWVERLFHREMAALIDRRRTRQHSSRQHSSPTTIRSYARTPSH